MNRDPFYGQILERLNRRLDPDLFEQCAADLLRTIYPGLTPIRGGSDSGMDGAIADGLGQPFPLIATTGSKVLRNLTASLDSYLRDGGTRRQVVLATSRSLTTKKRKNLHARAVEKGFELVAVHDQDAFANLLYRDPHWCQGLLNLPSNPPALSKIPRTERPLLNAPVIGRDASLRWLHETTGDRLLLGQPGSGKTFLLYQLAQEGIGLFLVSGESGEIAAGIREQEPTAIFVDDAAETPELLVALRHMREEMGNQFAIMATGWPGARTALVQALNLTNAQIHELEQLTRNEIKQVIYGVGITRPNYLVGEIVNQAEGRPGLAVTLALLCLQGGTRDVFSGDKLSDSIVEFAERFISRESAQILAVLAVAGGAGFTVETLAQLTGLNLLEVHRVLRDLAASGVVMDVGDGRLTVRPSALRHALVRNVFFRQVRLPIEPILARVPRGDEAALTLIGAERIGATIPPNLLRPLLIKCRSAEVWEAYAGLGREEAEWVLRDHPDMLAVVAEQGLFNAPETFLPALLTAAVGDLRPLHQFPDHPLRVIKYWIESASPGAGQTIRRRRLLLDATERWLPGSGDWGVGGHALQLVLSPSFHYQSVDPGQRLYVEFTDGLLLPYELRQLQSLWPRVLELISGIHVTDWSIVHQMVGEWVHGRRVRPDIPGQVREVMHDFAVQMLRDVVLLARQHPATQHWATGIVRRLGVDIVIELDPDFEILYPTRQDERDFNEVEERERAAVRALAERWSREAPEKIAQNIARIEAEANSAELTWPRWTPLLCNEIAIQVTSRGLWTRALMKADLSSNLVLPFLRLGAEANEEGWETTALECLDLPEMQKAAVDLALTLPHPPDELFERALQRLDDSIGYVRWACARGKIPEHHLRLLLRHPSAAIANAAAEGEWESDPQGSVRDTLREDWEQAVVHSSSDHYWLSEVFREIPNLAGRWLQNHLSDEELEIYDPYYEHVIQFAVSALTFDQRQDLLRRIPDRYGFSLLVANLVGDYHDLYRELLQNEHLRRYHSAPLASAPEGDWLEKAILAYNAGYSPAEIVEVTVFGHPGLTAGDDPWSERCSEYLVRFERLCTHPDKRIQKIGEAGRAWAIRELDDARKRGRREAVYGWGHETV